MSGNPSPHHAQPYNPHPSPSRPLSFYPGPHSSPHDFPTSTDATHSGAQSLGMVDTFLGQNSSPSRQSGQGERAGEYIQLGGPEQTREEDYGGGSGQWPEGYQQTYPFSMQYTKDGAQTYSQAQAQLPPPGQGHYNDPDSDPSNPMPAPVQPEQEPEEEFDPMAPVERFDAKGELESKWNDLQKDMVPFLQNFTNEALSNTYSSLPAMQTHREADVTLSFDLILQAHYMYHQLNTRMQKELVEGVKAIDEEEMKQEAARKVITDFSNEMKRAAEVLKMFGGSEAFRNVTQ
ncbi:hypothetical protein L202_07981 [Cryptococcus amylolentus CBS 6039]|uniref:Uncharacterized protein n=2 Tax=Cryptococcus amylolentus TaxID=104669 RepID=A0A1E3HAV4_9TREE|nr:hypothetical protein L202_07981 [Cryptococcus amylolentus CBS 6039]ODN73470.1 hypothetical protein L202_07981 [Cryptococcus amylolentus CBS 6039]ODN99228.1 hypothetical protein I350_07387 [Cryptococcus amylolentus CBS 6273]